MSPADTAVLIVAHGSRDEAARGEFLDQVRAISRELHETTVGHAVLEFPGETRHLFKQRWTRSPRSLDGSLFCRCSCLIRARARDIPAELGLLVRAESWASDHDASASQLR